MVFESGVVLITRSLALKELRGYVVLDVSHCFSESLTGFLESLKRCGLSLVIAAHTDPELLARSDVLRRATCIIIDSLSVERVYAMKGVLNARSLVIRVQDLRELIKLLSLVESLGRLPAFETVLHVVLREVVDEDVIEYVARNAARLGMECLIEGLTLETLSVWGFAVDGPRRQLCTYIVQRLHRDGVALYVKVGEASPTIVVGLNGVLAVSRSLAPSIVDRLPCTAKLNAIIEAVKRVGTRALDGYPLSIEPCITVSRGGKRVVIDGTLIRFLELIEEHRSMKRAAQELGLPQSTIRRRVREVEECLGVRLLECHRGGADRGYTELTEHGRELVRMYRALYTSFRKLLEHSENYVGVGAHPLDADGSGEH